MKNRNIIKIEKDCLNVIVKGLNSEVDKEKEVEKLKISEAKTIEEYKEIRDKKIQKWIDDNFVNGSVEWKMNGASAIKVTDKTGDSMVIQLAVID